MGKKYNLIKPDENIVKQFNNFWKKDSEKLKKIKLFDDGEECNVSNYIEEFIKYDEQDEKILKEDDLKEFLAEINKNYSARVKGGDKGIERIVEELKKENINTKEELKEKTVPFFVDVCKYATGQYTYSFATKVFSFLAGDKYPIIDSYVVTLLDTYDYDKKSLKSEWGNYDKYKENYDNFMIHFGLNCIYKEVDKFLWTYAKMLDLYWKDIGVLRFASISYKIN